ncbi:unnamed protein product [Rangifer tarandus platyrhynchus]|uniref:Uncharacterized protein n=2 Tax=Rangifer tarandus platyrhynchus TaxID=3082113 RepID=A0ACB0F618_RANTA|nr:unnamed protein product [Rangifer tarandus platyrhynchus]CAI9708490.1 unnamed protein product [Rangifer tarandus platyrhynchus]
MPGNVVRGRPEAALAFLELGLRPRPEAHRRGRGVSCRRSPGRLFPWPRATVLLSSWDFSHVPPTSVPGPGAAPSPQALRAPSCVAVAAYTPSALRGRCTAQPQGRGPSPTAPGHTRGPPCGAGGHSGTSPSSGQRDHLRGAQSAIVVNGGCSVLLGDLPVHL